MNNISIQFKGNYGFQAELLTGTIEVPDSLGGYVISTGCGSGKTTVIKEIIRLRYNDGILYCVDTREEAWKMYEWIEKNLINDPYYQDLTFNDVSVLCHDTKKTKEEYKKLAKIFLNTYKSDPESIMNKKILITTHQRIFTDLINYFLICNPSSPVELFNNDFSSLMQRDDLRKYVLIDETPQQLDPFHVYPATVLRNFRNDKNCGHFQNHFNSDLKYWFDTRFKNTEMDIPETNKLQKLKRDSIISLISKCENVHNPLKSSSISGEYKLNYYPIDLIHSNMKTMVIVWEGAGDILFQIQRDPNRCFQRIDTTQRNYDSNVQFLEFPHSQIRTDYEYIKSPEFENYIFRLAELIKQHNKTLVVVWQNVGYLVSGGEFINNYYDFIREKLNNYIPYELGKYEVTYYGAANTKSTNEFVDFDTIVLCGDWNVWDNLPIEEKDKLGKAYNINLIEGTIKLWYFVQLISRIGIRKHQGGIYNVYFTSQISMDFVNELSLYFNNNLVVFSNNRIIDTVRTKLENVKRLQERTINQIITLTKEYDPTIGTAIINDNMEYCCTITLNNIHRLLDTDPNHPIRKEKDRFDRTIGKNLEKFGVILNIVKL